MSSIISLLDFLLLLGAGVPESGMVEGDLTWKEQEAGLKKRQERGNKHVHYSELLNLESRTNFLQSFSHVYMLHACMCFHSNLYPQKVNHQDFCFLWKQDRRRNCTPFLITSYRPAVFAFHSSCVGIGNTAMAEGGSNTTLAKQCTQASRAWNDLKSLFVLG